MGKNSTTTTTSEPPKWAAPLFTQSAKEAQKLYKNDSGFHSWQGNTVADPSDQTMKGIMGLIGEANRGGALEQNPIDLTNRMLRTGGLSGQADRGIDSLYDLGKTGGLSGDARQGINSLYNMGQTGDAREGKWITLPSGDRRFKPEGDTAEKYYTDMAQGDMLKGSPFFNKALKDQTDRTADQVNLSMAGSGRYGSGAHTGTLTDAIGEMRTRALNENYGRERGYQMEAIRGLTDADQRKFSNRLQAIQSGAGLEQQTFGNKIQAIQSGAGLEQQGAQTGLGYINALPTVQQNRVFDDNLRLQAGGMLDQQNQADLNNRIRKFTEKDMEDITRLGFLQSAASGAAGPYGTSHQMSQQPFNPMSLFSLLGLFGI